MFPLSWVIHLFTRVCLCVCVCRATTWATTLTAKTRTRQLQRVSISCHNAAAVCQSVRLTQDLAPPAFTTRLPQWFYGLSSLLVPDPDPDSGSVGNNSRLKPDQLETQTYSLGGYYAFLEGFKDRKAPTLSLKDGQ